MPLSLLEDKKKPEPSPKPTPPPAPKTGLVASASGTARGSDEAFVSTGSLAEGATQATKSNAVAGANGKEVSTSLQVSGSGPTSSANVKTGGRAQGANGASILSLAETVTLPNAATTFGE